MDLRLVLCLLLAGSRGLDEAPSLAKLAKAAPRAVVSDRCKDALDDGGLIGIECRATVAAASVAQKPVVKAADADARASLSADLVKAASSVSSWDPLTPPPGLARSRFEAHRAISRALMKLYDDVKSAADGAVAAKAGALKDGACNAAARTVELGTVAASIEERGEAQALVTSHECFLDEGKLALKPTPTALKGSTDPAALAATDAGAIRDYAASRAIDLKRCSDKHVSAALAIDDEKKLLDCTCSAMSKWKTPKPRTTVSVAIPLVADLVVRVHVNTAGAVEQCVSVGKASAPLPP